MSDTYTPRHRAPLSFRDGYYPRHAGKRAARTAGGAR